MAGISAPPSEAGSDRPSGHKIPAEIGFSRFTVIVGLASSWVLAFLMVGAVFMRNVGAPFIIWLTNGGVTMNEFMLGSGLIAGWVAAIYTDLQNLQVLARSATKIGLSNLDKEFSRLPVYTFIVISVLYFVGIVSLGWPEIAILLLWVYRALVDGITENWTSSRLLLRLYGVDPFAGR